MKIIFLHTIVIVILLSLVPIILSNRTSKLSDYSTITDLIIKTAMKSSNISKIEYLCDTFGPRRPGTPNIDNAIDWIIETMKQESLQNVRGEPVPNITNWVRGKESLEMLSPRQAELSVLAFGNSIGTTGITAEVLVVSSFDDLKSKASLVKGKIVVYNTPWVSYGSNVQYRVFGADRASELGGVAALVRSVTPYSLYTTHTGGTYYSGSTQKIPTAAITIEDAEMFHRMQNRGQKVILTLKMEAETRPQVSSRNIIAEVVGSQRPEQLIVMGGHVDSWDVGVGAMDDGGGIYSAWDALRIINDLIKSGDIPRPKRTIRVVMWVDEELSGRGSRQYAATHASELNNHVLAIESDSGNFDPVGFGFTGKDAAKSIISQILGNYTKEINTTNVFDNGCDVDNGVLCQLGIPGGSLISRGFNDIEKKDYYFNYHHSRADTITSLNYDGLRRSVASFAVLSYIVADLDQTLPR